MNNIKSYNDISSLLDLPIKELQNISVYIFDEKKFKEVYEYGNDKRYDNCKQMFIYDNRIKGVFMHKEYPDSFDSPFIMMIEGIPIEKQIVVFFHEYGHYKCYINKCSCFNFHNSSEIHAWKNSFELMLHYKCYKSLIIALQMLKKYDEYDGDKFEVKNLFTNMSQYNKPVFRRVEKWIKNCPKKYKNNLIRIDNNECTIKI